MLNYSPGEGTWNRDSSEGGQVRGSLISGRRGWALGYVST